MEGQEGKCGSCAFWEKLFGRSADGNCLVDSPQRSGCQMWASLKTLKDNGPLRGVWQMLTLPPRR